MQPLAHGRRRRRAANRGLLALALAALAGSAPGAGAPSDAGTTVFVNARVFTADPVHPYAQAVAVRGERILAVGESGAVQAAAGPGARSVDLGGRFLMPGMIDGHAHVIGSRLAFGGGQYRVLAALADGEVSVDRVVEVAARAVQDGASRFGDVNLVANVDIGNWAFAQQIDARLSAPPFATTPVVLLGNDGHTAWGNRAARERAGITAAALRAMTPDQRAYYGHGEDFVPNGFVVDVGLSRLRGSLPEPSAELVLASARAGVHYMNAQGITGWLDAAAAGVVGGDVPLSEAEEGALPAYRELARRGELTAHVAALPVIKPRLGLAQIEVAESLRRRYAGIENLTMPGIKVFADGVVEYPSQTAALTQPYRNSGRLAPLAFEPAAFNALVTEADRRGLLVHIHAIGNLAVKASLDAIGAARQANPASRLAHTITHAQFVDAQDVPRFAQVDAIATLQLFWALADPTTNEEVKPYIDPAIHRTLYPARSLLEAGTVIAGASDWPVSTADPFQAIAQAETRVGPQGVLFAAERMPRLAMLYAYTRNAARAIGLEERIGSLEPGKQADLVLLDRDVLTVPVDELRQAQVIWTMFGGRVVYQAETK